MRSLILASILLSVLHGTLAQTTEKEKNWFEELDTGVIIGAAAGLALLVILLLVLTCFCFGCACFATSKAIQKNTPAQGQVHGQKRSPQARSLEPVWDNSQPQRPQQQQYIPPSTQIPNGNQKSSLEDEHGIRPQSQLSGYQPQHMHQPENYPQSPQPDMYPHGNNQNFDRISQQSQSQLPGSHSPSPQPQSYPQSPQPQNGPSFNDGYPTSPQEQYEHQYGKEYPISQEQFQHTPTSRIVPGFRYPEGLIEELRTDGNTKLKPPPPPKPIKLMSQIKEDVPPPDY